MAWNIVYADRVPDPQTGLIFPSNYVSGSDIALDWAGAVLLPRVGHTAVWKARFVQQTGYYAWAWHSHTDNAWHGDSEFGCHPYPSSDGAVDGTGTVQPGSQTGGSGTVHYHELAGLGAHDFLRTAGESPGVLVTKGVWYSQARACANIGGGVVRHWFWPDLDNNPTFVIVQDYAAATIAAAEASYGAWKFRFGVSPWRTGLGGGDATSNDETPSGTFRHLLLYDRAMNQAEVQAKAALQFDDTDDPDVWYSCINPTPSDVSDKSGAGHSPSWANARRPTLYTA